ncbi:hypothetical protein GQ43DRAFT_437325 [Delitschia confertaspora ATCC 74209]|uniref:BZIP domain-containing protein n=1 Tax=Delitschia confertaspora ATCC 74209 TaxID=1513339 RepID=A0A9P4JT54_9PLEO|nr:hypothetical protein GQ43DRAFT_437325 [Delitschia confertaspora ATCC 74209]
MDYSYFGAPPQTYHFIGMPPAGQFPHTSLDPEIPSNEPLDASFLQPSFDSYSFHHIPATNGSPDALIPPSPGIPMGSVDSGLGLDMEDRGSRNRSSSEEKESQLTPAQSRRKAQNRAAQRAFRERKERHVKDLETKLSALESSAKNLQSDNERLKLALQRAKTENEILRATSAQYSPASSRPVSASFHSPGSHLRPDEESDEEADYNVQSLTHGTVINSADKTHKRSSGGKAIPANQTWDLLQSHPLIKNGAVDITDVFERLKGKAKCSGHGPVFEESVIMEAVEESRRSGGDVLI